MTHQMTRFVIDAEKAVLNRPQPDSRVGGWLAGCLAVGCCCMHRPAPEAEAALQAARAVHPTLTLTHTLLSAG